MIVYNLDELRVVEIRQLGEGSFKSNTFILYSRKNELYQNGVEVTLDKAIVNFLIESGYNIMSDICFDIKWIGFVNFTKSYTNIDK